MPEPTGPSDPIEYGGQQATEYARHVATDPGLPSWAAEVVGLLLAGDEPTVDLLETLATEAGVLFGRGRAWLEHPSR